MDNLKTKEGRQSALENINKSFIKSLRDKGLEICDTAVCMVGDRSIELGIEPDAESKAKGCKIIRGSIVEIYAKDTNSISDREKTKINFATSGCFEPSEIIPYWRTIHAASILKNWAVVSDIVQSHCQMYRDLLNKVSTVNNIAI